MYMYKCYILIYISIIESKSFNKRTKKRIVTNKLFFLVNKKNVSEDQVASFLVCNVNVVLAQMCLISVMLFLK